MTIEKSVLVPLDADQAFALLTEPERLRLIQPALGNVDAFGEEVSVSPAADPTAQFMAHTGRQP